MPPALDRAYRLVQAVCGFNMVADFDYPTMSVAELFMETLFDPGEAVCFGASERSIKVTTQNANPGDYQFVSLNPLFLNLDRNPTETWHRPNIGRRADMNVTTFRNILIESDSGNLLSQYNYISNKRKLPYSTLVFSGNKSLHFIISLKKPLRDKEEYKNLVERIYNRLGTRNIDESCKNPSRFTRMPCFLRGDTGKEQRLLKINGRIDNDVVQRWIKSQTIQNDEDESQETTKTYKPKTKSHNQGKGIGQGRNVQIFNISCTYARAGIEIDETISELSSQIDLGHEELRKTILSAYSIVKNGT